MKDHIENPQIADLADALSENVARARPSVIHHAIYLAYECGRNDGRIEVAAKWGKSLSQGAEDRAKVEDRTT